MAAVILKYKVDNGNQYRVRGINYSGTDRVHTIGSKEGYMYISIPGETVTSYLPQPDEVDINVVTVTPTVSSDMCKWGSVFLSIDKRTRRAIRDRYSIDEEFKALRTADTEYSDFVEELISTGKQEKLEILGLS